MIETRADYIQYFQEDLKQYKLARWKWSYRFRYPIVYFLKQLRYLEYIRNKQGAIFHKLHMIILKARFRKLSMQLGFTIPPNVFGPGLYIPHYGTIVVNGNARIGSHCRLCTDVCIGDSNGGVPHIGNHVYIAPGVKIFGDIHIGDHTFIGANAVVNKSFKSGVTIAGVPARVVANSK